MTDKASTSPETLKKILYELLTELPKLLVKLSDSSLSKGDQFEDLVQETRLAVLSRFDPEKFDPRQDARDSLRAFVFTAARAKTIDYHRRRKRGFKVLEHHISDEAAEDNMTPSWLVAKDQAEAVLQECLLKLAPDDRHLVERKYFDGAPMNQIASESGLSEDALDNRMRRIRKELKNYLGSSGSVRFEIRPR